MSIKSVFAKKRILTILFFVSVFSSAQCIAQSMEIVRKRPPQLDLTSYQKIAIGDFVGPTGAKTTRAMDLADAITSRLFNSSSYEIIDRNALYQLLNSQRGSEITTITESTTASLSKMINSAVIILGRIQDEKVNKEQKSVDNSIIVNGCYKSYWYHVTGNITAQIKILDVKTGKMLFTNPVTQNIDFETKRECEPYRLSDDSSDLLKETLNKLADKIAQIAVPYDEKVNIPFENQAITIFKNPFKKLPNAIASFSVNDNDNGLAMLKAYVDDKSLKDNLKEKAIYNYGVGLFLSGQDDPAIEQLKLANTLGSMNATHMMEIVENERTYRNKLQSFKDKLAATVAAAKAAADASTATAAAAPPTPAATAPKAKKVTKPVKRTKP